LLTDAGLVAVEDVLHDLRGLRRDLLAPFVQGEVHLALADHLAHGGFGGLQHGLVGIAVVEEVFLRILEEPLHGELDVDDVLVVGQHQGFLEHLVLVRTAIADLDDAHIGQLDDFMAWMG
jgi:hypothetical protein